VPSIEEVLGKIKVPVRAVRICLDADLQAEHDELTARLDVLRRETQATMGQSSEAKEVAERIREVEAEMRESEVTFKFRGLTKAGLRKLFDRFPPPEDTNLTWDVEEGSYALLAASAVSPTMTEEQAKQLLEQMSQGHADRMVGAAWLASTGSTSIPFSERASALTSGTGSN
jgi:small-conductance mechanosensitive channel